MPTKTQKTKREPANLARQVEALKTRKANRLQRFGGPVPNPEGTDMQTAVDIENKFDTRDCEQCKQPFRSCALVIDGIELFRARYCETCLSAHEIEDEERRAQEMEQRRANWIESEWARVCPPRYAEPFDLERLIKSIKAQKPNLHEDIFRCTVDKVLNWPHSERGLGLIGKSGFGKTRIMFQLMRRYIERGLICRYINLAVFGREVGARFGASATEANAWINKLCSVPVLFLDDVGKEKMTERVETELYGIIECRSANLLPIYFTANFNGDKLIEKMTNDDGEESDRALPIVRRLREFCEPIAI